MEFSCIAKNMWDRLWFFLAPSPPEETITSDFFYGTTTLAPAVWSSSNSLCETELPV
jgi:hypothetical protein